MEKDLPRWQVLPGENSHRQTRDLVFSKSSMGSTKYLSFKGYAETKYAKAVFSGIYGFINGMLYICVNLIFFLFDSMLEL